MKGAWKTRPTEDKKVERILSKIWHVRNVQSKPRLAAQMLRAHLERLPPRKRTANLYLALANLYVDIGETAKAQGAFRSAAETAETAKDPVSLADVLRKWGYLHLHTDTQFAEARRLIARAVQLIDAVMRFDRSRTTLAVAANCYASLGNLYHLQHKIREAKAAYRKALAFAKRARSKGRIVTVLSDLGSIAIREHCWKLAERLLMRALRNAKGLYHHAVPSTLLRLARLFDDKANPNRDAGKAMKYWLESELTAGRGGWKRELADALADLGKAKKAKEIYRKLGYRRELSWLKH